MDECARVLADRGGHTSANNAADIDPGMLVGMIWALAEKGAPSLASYRPNRSAGDFRCVLEDSLAAEIARSSSSSRIRLQALRARSDKSGSAKGDSANSRVMMLFWWFPGILRSRWAVRISVDAGDGFGGVRQLLGVLAQPMKHEIAGSSRPRSNHGLVGAVNDPALVVDQSGGRGMVRPEGEPGDRGKASESCRVVQQPEVAWGLKGLVNPGAAGAAGGIERVLEGPGNGLLARHSSGVSLNRAWRRSRTTSASRSRPSTLEPFQLGAEFQGEELGTLQVRVVDGHPQL